MKTSNAILAGPALIALAIGVAGITGRAGTTPENYGHYAVATGSNFFTVLDTAAGDVRVCIVNGSCQEMQRK